MSRKRTKYTIPRAVQQAGETAVLRFVNLVENHDCDPDCAFTEMQALRRFPAIMTDDVAAASMPTIAQMAERDPEGTQRLCQIATRNGYRPKPTDCYLASVANREGDPAAFLNHGHGIDAIRKTLNQRGYAATRGDDGLLLSVQSNEPDHDAYEQPKHKLNPKILRRKMKQAVAANPDLASTPQRRARLQQDLIATHGPN